MSHAQVERDAIQRRDRSRRPTGRPAPPRQKVYYNGLVEFAPVGDLPAVWRNLSRPESSLGCILVPLPSAAPLVTDCHWLAEDRR